MTNITILLPPNSQSDVEEVLQILARHHAVVESTWLSPMQTIAPGGSSTKVLGYMAVWGLFRRHKYINTVTLQSVVAMERTTAWRTMINIEGEHWGLIRSRPDIDTTHANPNRPLYLELNDRGVRTLDQTIGRYLGARIRATLAGTKIPALLSELRARIPKAELCDPAPSDWLPEYSATTLTLLATWSATQVSGPPSMKAVSGLLDMSYVNTSRQFTALQYSHLVTLMPRQGRPGFYPIVLTLLGQEQVRRIQKSFFA